MAADRRLERLLRKTAFWLPLCICTWMALGSGLPSGAPKVSDVSLHLFAFAYLTTALRIAYPAALLWIVVPVMLFYGGLIELIQAFLPARQAEWKDVAVDSLGVAVGLLLHALVGEKVWRLFLSMVRLSE